MAAVPSEQPATKGHSAGTKNVNPGKQQLQQQRQLLSCTKCRERKVKCDRTKPCSACCVRGSPRDCQFIAEDGNYTPIRQSYELRKLRAENLRLKERLHSLRVPIDGENFEHVQAVDSQFGEKPPSWFKRKQQGFQTSESHDSVYFGSPGLATVLNEFAITNTSTSTTLTHIMPHPADIFVMGDSSTYPFATLFSASLEDCIPQLLGCLPSKQDIMRYLSAFEKQLCPQIPVEITKREVERFLSDAKGNSQQCPAMLGLLLAVIALGAQHSVWGRNNERWDADIMIAETRAGSVYIAAAMQALRLASFMHRPSILAIQVLVMIGKYLINSGKFLDAFTLFGTTIRLAHSIGLHCHPKYLDPSPPTTKDIMTRQKIWWYMLRVDEEFSMTLGRPLGISGIGTCRWPQELTTDPNIVRFGEYINQFTLLARQILGSDQLTNLRIDEFTDALRALSETLPETLRFEDTWANPASTLPLGSWPLSAMAAVYYCKMNTYLILLNRQRVEKHASSSATFNNTGMMSAFTAVNRASSVHLSPSSSRQASLRGRSLVIASSEDIISAFLFFHQREPSALVDWTIGQQAFNSCMILLLDAIERRTVTFGSSKVGEALNVFKILKDNHVHKLAACAVDRIEKGFKELHESIDQINNGDCHARLQPGKNTISSGVGQTKAVLGSGYVDTVMGHTGMLLIEGAGLQAFVKEEFSPTTWGIPCLTKDSESEIDTSRYHSEGKRASEFTTGTSNEQSQTRQCPKIDGDSGLYRPKSLRYASERLVIAMGDDHKPHGYTASTPSTDRPGPHKKYNMMTSEHHGWQPSRDQGGAEPLHFHGQWHEPDGRGCIDWQYYGSPNARSGEEQHTNLLRTSIDAQQSVQAAQRHDFCPAISQSVECPPILRPTQSSPNSVGPGLGPQLVSPYLYPHANPHQTHQQQNQCMENCVSQDKSLFRRSVNTLSSIAEVPRGDPTVHGDTQWQQGQILYPVTSQPYGIGIQSTSNLGMNIEEWQHEW